MRHVTVPADTAIGNDAAKVTVSGVGSVLAGLIVNVTNAAAATVTISDQVDAANSLTTIVATAVTANGSFSLNFYGAQSKKADWRIGTAAGVTVVAVVEG
jgi:hypothetical protein